MKNIILLLFIALTSISTSFAEKTAQMVDTSKLAKFTTLETVPGYKIKIYFSTHMDCLFDGKIKIKKYESQEKLNNVDTGKIESVRIVHLYGISKPQCDEGKGKELTQTYEVPADSKRMTHVYLTFEAPIKLQNSETVK